MGWTATNALRADLTGHCLRLDMTFHNTRTPGEWIERVDGDVTALANFFSQFVIRLLGNLLLLVGVLLLLFREDVRLGAVFTVFSAAGLLALNRVRNVGVPQWQAVRQASADFFGFLEERLAASEDIRSSGTVPYVLHRFYELSRARLRKERTAGLMGTSTIALFTVGYALAFALGSSLYAHGTATVGTVYLLFQYIALLERPIRQVTAQMEDLQKAGAGLRRIDELYRTAARIQDGPGSLLPPGPLAVELDRVTFAYSENEPVLRDLSFHLAPGRVLGLLGRTGSGKSTIARLCLRLYDPLAGVVRIGGVDARDPRVADLRARIGVVTQDIQLFHATVRDNLTLFDRTVQDERLCVALRELGLEPWYTALPAGLDTVLQPGGLSAGQAQLLAFARVFLGDPDLVILDEASSRLDPATERVAERALAALLRGRTAIIIAHRLTTVERADEIMILEDGRVVEHGPREALAVDAASRFHGLLRHGLLEALA